jgi:hypothetical protein
MDQHVRNHIDVKRTFTYMRFYAFDTGCLFSQPLSGFWYQSFWPDRLLLKKTWSSKLQQLRPELFVIYLGLLTLRKPQLFFL